MGLRPGAVGNDPVNLCLQQGDARAQFIYRKVVERFPGQLAGQIPDRARAFVDLHYPGNVACWFLLSTGRVGRCAKGFFGLGSLHMLAEIENTVGALPPTMVAIAIAAPGGPEMLRPETLAVPQPGPGQVLIRVAHAGVNRPDIIQRLGLYPPPPGASPIPGLEVAGYVVACGAGVVDPMPGSAVAALVNGGGYAQYCLAQADHCLPVPPGLSLAEAAALPETLFTVWHNVFERAYACDGETILVHGGTSGIGTMAITLARLFGLTTIVTCGSAEKCARALKLGANHAIDYKTADFVAEVAAITQGRGVEIVLDMVAGAYVPRNLQCLAPDGRHVTIAVQGGMRAEINMADVMVRRLVLTGSTLRPRTNAFKAALAAEIREIVWPLADEGRLRPIMDTSFALADAAAAHARMESGGHVGKIVLNVAG